MPRVWLDDEFHSHPKVIAAGLDGAGLFARALSYCGAYLTDGFVPQQWAQLAAGGKRPVLKRLTEVGLWKPVKGGFRIPDYLEHNDSKAEVLKYRAERSKSGKKGARRRWGGGKAAPPLFDEDDNSHGESYSDSHGSSDSSSYSESHDLANGKTHGSSMARDRAATTNTSTTTPAAEEQEQEPSLPAAALAGSEAPREARVREVVDAMPTAPGDESSSFNQILPLALQLDTASFEEVVTQVGQRRDVGNPRGLLRWMLANAAGQRMRQTTAALGGPSTPYIVAEPPPQLEEFVQMAVRYRHQPWADEDLVAAFEKWEVDEQERPRLLELAASARLNGAVPDFTEPEP